MKLLQTYYTSCRVGQTGSSGFQFYSYSGGITETELDEIGKLGSYTAPYGSPSSPTAEEVLTLLPVAFKYFRLSSGRVGVLQSTACTQEYTGRPGNFFTHALILDEGLFPFMPILLHKCKYFRHDLTEEQKHIRSVPPLLPPLIVSETEFTPADTSWKDFSLQQFIRRERNEELLSQLLDIVQTGKSMQKGIVLADHKPEEIIYALSNALPAENTAGFTFSTYSLAVHQPGQNITLSASWYEGTDFNFDDPGMSFSYYVFNKVTGKYVKLEDQSEFSKLAIRQLASDPRKVDELYACLDNFEQGQEAKDRDLIAAVFCREDFTSKWRQILPFVAEKAKPAYVETFLNEYREQIIHLKDTLQDEREISRFFEDLLSLIRKLKDSTAWLDDLYSCYVSIWVRRLDSPTKSFVGLNKRILSLVRSAGKEELEKQIVSHHTFLLLAKEAHTELAVMNVFILIISSLKAAGKGVDDLFSMEEIRWLVKNIDEDRLSSDSFDVLISEFADDMDKLLLQITGIKADHFTKRFIRELAGEKNNGAFYGMLLKGVPDDPRLTDEIRKEIMLQLEKRALVNIPSGEELKVYAGLKKWLNASDYPAIQLILAEKDTLPERIWALKDVKKLSVFLEWRPDTVFLSLRRPGDWKKFISISEQLASFTLSGFIEAGCRQAGDFSSLIALVVFAHDEKDRELDELLRKNLSGMKRSAYTALKQEVEQCPGGVYPYFISLKKGILKQLFNLKFL